MPQLDQQVVLITGASRGIGAATARNLAAAGAHVALVGLEPERLAQLSRELGPSSLWLEGDVTDPAAMERAVTATLTRFGRLDCVVANAGIALASTLETVDPALFRQVMDVNFMGTWNIMRASLPALISTRGYFLAVASGAAALPLLGMNAYSPSKAAVESLCDTLRAEVAHRGVGVGVAYFSFMDTDMVSKARTPMADVLRSRLPYPLNTIYPVDKASQALLDGIRRRSSRVIAPKALGCYLALRWWLNALLPYKAKATMAQLEL
jgi:NAD(P)-dependent dehydrogenase (short-subunit alcohol dehydrogenase family)